MLVGRKEVMLPTMMVGNYPKPRWYVGPSYQVPLGSFMPDAVSFEAFEDTIAAIVRDQEMAGLDVIADGLVLGGDSPYAAKLYYITERLNGFVNDGPPLSLPTYSTLFSPTVDGPVSRKGPLMLNQVKTLRKLTDKPIKVNFPGLQVLAMGAINRYYSDVKELAFDLAKAYNQEFKELVDAGVDIIQLDEFTWHYGLSLGDWEIDAFNAAIDGVDAQTIVHVCWGNYLGTPGYLPSGAMHGDADDKEGSTYVLSLRERGATTARARAVMPRAQKLNFDVLNYEIAHKGVGDLSALAKVDWQKPFVAGVIDVKSVEVEQAEDVADRIRACLDVVPAERLGVSTDCGLINLPRIVAQAKLRALVEGTKIVRAEVAAREVAVA